MRTVRCLLTALLLVALVGCDQIAQLTGRAPQADESAAAPAPPEPADAPAEEQPSPDAEPAADDAEPAAADAEPAAEGDEAAADEPAEGEGEPAAAAGPDREAGAAPADEAAGPAPVRAAAGDVEGLVLNPRDDVQILLPDGWEEGEADGDTLVRMVRAQPVGGVRVNVSVDATADRSLPDDVTLKAVEQKFVQQLTSALAERDYRVRDSRRVTLAGQPALAVRGELTDDGRALRSKQYILLQDNTFWTLSVIGPRDEFDTVVEPEFDAIAQSLELR